MHSSSRLKLAAVVISLAGLAEVCLGASKAQPSQPDRAAGLPATLSAQTNYGNLPLAFEPNTGQFDPQVRFLSHSQGMTVFFTGDEAVMVLHRTERPDPRRSRRNEVHRKADTEVVRMKLAGAAAPARTEALEKLPGTSNYFIGNDPAKWRTNIPNYGRIRYKGVYPGVDMVAYGNQRQLEYDLVVAPGADASRIELAWEGAGRMELDSAGDLVLTTRLGDVVQKRPRVYQEIGGRPVEIAAHYSLRAGGRVQFALARYDRGLPLVIDPVTVVYGTYLGSSEQGTAIAVDATGAAYVTGYTYDALFPLKTPFQSTNKDANCSGATTFVTKLAPAGNALVYSSYLGGSCEDDPNGIAVDGNGAAYIVGTAGSLDFPRVNPYQSSCPNNIPGGQYGGVFVTKIQPAGYPLAYSTYLCGGYSDHGGGIAVDINGSAYVTGDTSSNNWPVKGPHQLMLNGDTDAFVTKLSVDGGSLVYSTYLGGSGNDCGTSIALDSTGAAYIGGWTDSSDYPVANALQSKEAVPEGWYTGFVTKLSPDGTSLGYSTYLGGSGEEKVLGIAVDAGNAAFVTGYTYSTDFPTRYPAQSTNNNPDAGTCFVTKLATAGNALIWSTYLGGSPINGTAGDVCYGIAADNAKESWVTGRTDSPDFPVLLPYQASMPGTNLAFVTKYSSTGTMAYSTFLGGNGDAEAFGIAIDSAGAAYITGDADSENFPVPNGYQRTTGPSGGPFVAKLQLSGSATTVVNTTPTGLTFTVDGTTYTTGQSFTWTAGTSHTIGVTSPQTVTGGAGTRYAFASWSDSGAASHTITASSAGGTYTASFTTQYLLTVAESPAAGGTVTENPPSSDLYYNSGTSVQLTAAANPGYSFASWSGDLSGTTNSQSVGMTAPHSVTATFHLTSTSATPLAVSVTPAAGSWASATYTFTFSDSAGWQHINVADILINDFLDGRNACYVAVVPSAFAVYLVDDAGDAGGPYQVMTLPGSATAQNSQCSISGTGSSISGSGTTLTVTLAMTFKAAFAGNKVMYLAAGDVSGANSNWQALGTCGVPGPAVAGPAVGGVSPARTSGPGGGSFVYTFTDTNGWQDLGVVNILINNALDGRQACYLAYSRPYNVLFLVNDAGNALLPALTLNGSGTLSNSQCTITGAGSSASGAGNTLTLTLNMTFPSSFAGNRIIYMAARSNGDALNSGWQAVGSRTVQ